MARAYLTENEYVRVLVPLDEAKRLLDGTPYSIAQSSESDHPFHSERDHRFHGK